MGLTNIEYGQADILKISEIARTFDIIESVGYCIIWPIPLRMANPAVAIAAWRIHVLGLLQRTCAQTRGQGA